MKIIHYDCSLFFSSNLILLAELAEEHWRDLAALLATGSQCVQHLVKVLEALLFSRKCELLTIRTNRKERMLNWRLWRKSQHLFYRQNLAVICSASSVCKIGVKLYTVASPLVCCCCFPRSLILSVCICASSIVRM
jgi:hypothetical protein